MNLDPNPNYFPNLIPQGFQFTHPNSILTQQQQQQHHQDHHQVLLPSNSIEVPVTSVDYSSGMSLLSGLSLLNDRVHQVQLLVKVLTAPDLVQHEPTAISPTVASIGSLIQEIIGTANSMMFYCQQPNHLNQTSTGTAVNNNQDDSIRSNELNNWDGQKGLCHDTVDNLYVANFNIEATDRKTSSVPKSSNSHRVSKSQPIKRSLCLEHATTKCNKNDTKNTDEFEIIELEAADLLAKYTHYCQICGKGFKRDANLRMHMRAHGDEYKSSAALSKPPKIDDGDSTLGTMNGNIDGKKFSCPQQGCRWNKNHPKFQPLKSMICVKNHYKRSHCPKIYICKRCNRKQFSVLSDLKTHEKHCGDAKWRCTCGTTFSRKDKLMGHVSLFVGHAPAVHDEGMRRSCRPCESGRHMIGDEDRKVLFHIKSQVGNINAECDSCF